MGRAHWMKGPFCNPAASRAPRAQQEIVCAPVRFSEARASAISFITTAGAAKMFRINA